MIEYMIRNSNNNIFNFTLAESKIKAIDSKIRTLIKNMRHTGISC